MSPFLAFSSAMNSFELLAGTLALTTSTTGV